MGWVQVSSKVRFAKFVCVIKKIEKVLAVWRMRSLTLSGKITVLKSLIFSKIVFVSFLSNIPKCIIKNLITLKRSFKNNGWALLPGHLFNNNNI